MNKNLLEAKCVEHGYTLEQLSKLLGISTVTFYRKKNGISDFTRREIQIMRALLKLSARDVELIFFGD